MWCCNGRSCSGLGCRLEDFWRPVRLLLGKIGYRHLSVDFVGGSVTDHVDEKNLGGEKIEVILVLSLICTENGAHHKHRKE